MDLNVNEGTHPSRFELGRYAAGELTDAQRADVEARLDDAGRAWLAEIEAAGASLPAFDATALRARAGVAAAPANNTRWFVLLAVLAAVLLGVVLVSGPDTPAEVDPNYVGVRGAAPALELHVYQDGALRPWDGRAVGAGDRIGFKVDATGRRGVVLLSVDGDGQVSVFWPEAGDAPEPLRGDGVVPLPGSLTLDGATGPEVFLAVFDRSPAEARAQAASAWQSGGSEGLVGWARSADHVDAVVVERR